MNMEKLIEGLLNLATDLAIKIVTCLVVFVIGNYLIKRVVRMLDKSRLMKLAVKVRYVPLQQASSRLPCMSFWQ